MMPQQYNKAKVSITLDLDVQQFVMKLAEEESRSFSQQINKILRDYMKEKQGDD